MTAADDVPIRPGNAPEYEYRRESSRDFGLAVLSVERAIEGAGFVVRVMHDIQATLAAKGFRVDPIRIYEIDGSAELVDELCAGADPCPMDRLMPCRVNVFVDGERTAITALRPTLLCRIFPEEPLDPIAAALEDRVVSIVDQAANA